MSATKEEREPTTSSSPLKETHDHHDHEAPPPLFLPPFDFEPVTNIQKRAKFSTISSAAAAVSPPQWKAISPKKPKMGIIIQNPESSSSPSNPDTSSSPSLSPVLKSQHHQLRKGKHVSPVWKPHEMLWLAKAWKVQYQGDSSGSGSGFGSEGGSSGGRGKSRAEKDREVAEFLSKHGVNRDAKTAGTKWDNMLGEFRKVYEWEKGGEREHIGKSYFRLSPYERKIHRLPASFDEEVFEELSQFMGSRMRPSTTSSSHHHHHNQGGPRSSTFIMPSSLIIPSSDHLSLKALPPPPSFKEHESFPLSGRTRQMESYVTHNPRSALLALDPNPQMDVGMSSPFASAREPRAELRRIGKVRMTWEESISLWAEEGECHSGRIKVQGSDLLNADELIYFDDSMVPCAMEAFEDGPLKGFSVDKFCPGQQIKVFGRKKSYYSSTPFMSTGFSERIPFPIAEQSTRWEFEDPTEYYLGCLRAPTTTVPSLLELSWYIKEPPLEEYRLPLRKDIYRDLPQGKELFFTTSSSEPLDCKSFMIDIVSSLIRSTPSISSSTSTSRESYIAIWDDCINRAISKFCPSGMVIIRKQSDASNSQSLQDRWPNICGMVKNFCLWRGEEVNQIKDSHPLDPASSITAKISWTYQDIPYVLGYYAVGHNVTFCAFSPSSATSTSIIRTDLLSLDLSNPSERLKSLIPCWRIGVLLAALADKCTMNQNVYSDFERLDLGNDNIFEMTPNIMTKLYNSKRKYQASKEIYDVLDQRIPHAEYLFSYDERELALMFKPRGIKAKPKNCEELVLALKQVTKALVALHDLSFMHRDLSWDKVMMRARKNNDDEEGEQEEWFVTGFEEAVGAPQINPVGAEDERERSLAPEMTRGVHGVKVDVWGVGYLIKTSGVTIGNNIINKQLKELEVRCMEMNPELRPTAADCYHHLLQIQSSLSSAAKGGIAATDTSLYIGSI